MLENTTMFVGIICILKGVIEYAAKNVYDNLNRAENRHDKMKHQSENKRKKMPSLKLKKRVKRKRMLNVAAPCGLQEITGAGMNAKQSENDVADANNKLDSFGSNISAEEIDFIQDSSDYQWFTDYNYRDNTSSIRPSILSSLSASYMYNDLDCYNDIARDIDVNLAQVDIEDFRAEDIHSLLHTLPQICNSDVQNEQHGEMYASVSGSLMVKYDFDSSLSHHSTSQEESNGSTGSFYKSEILFSPVKEVPLASFSTDSLDCDEHILLTCQANKDNYTIAFEGSTIMGGSIDAHSNTNDELIFSRSISQEGKSTAESSGKTSLNILSSESSNCAASSEKLLREISLHSSDGLVRSSSPYTTWSKLKENSSESIKKHSSHSSDSENAAATSSSTNSNLHALPTTTTSCVYLKSQSLPNLNPMKNYLLRHNKLLTTSHPKNKNPFEVNTNHLDGRVKIYSLSNSDYRKKRYRLNCAAPGGTNLISRFINQKYTKNFNMPMNSSYNLQPNNSLINEHSYHPQSAFQNKTNFTTEHRCFEDSLVENATVNRTAESTIKYDTNATAGEYTLYDSCSSFSSHTGKLLDTTNVSESKFGTAVASTGKSTRRTAVNKVAKNNSFDSAMNIMKSDKKDRFSTEKHSVSEPCPIRIMDRSIQTSLTINCEKNKATAQTQSGETVVNTDKPVYVMYPNYTLPDLSFLLNHATELDLKNVFLWPQKFTPSPTTERDDSSLGNKFSSRTEQKKRPCSCPDLDSLKNRNYNHIRDWKSLMFLLPREYCQFLMQIPELENRFKGSTIGELGRSSLCTSGLQEKPLNLAESVNSTVEPKVTCVSSSSTATQPSSGYRGSSTMLLTDSSAGSAPCSPFYMYKNDNRVNCKAYDNESVKTAKSYGCERPPLPRGILRNTFLQNSRDNKQQSNNNKRYSMYELREGHQPPVEKRRSLPSHLASDGITRTKSRKEEFVCYSEDEGVESASSHCESPGPQIDQDARRLEQLLQENISWNEEDMAQLRDHVGHCLSQAGRKTVSFANLSHTPPNSPNSSVITGYKPYQMKLQPAFDIPIHEECESARHSYCDHSSSEQMHWTSSCSYKKDLMDSVDMAAHNLRSCFNEKQCDNDIAQTALMLCPTLYAVLNHGLKPTLETPFGDINNSVWQVVEASSQQGPMTRALNELVLKLNSEDVLTEGLLKFNAFIFGLLNVRGLDTWFSYLRTRETILRKHYLDHSLLLSCSRGISSDRQLIDHLLSTLKPLTQYNFKLDLLYECRQLHTSLMQLGKNSPSNMVHNINSNNRTSWVLKKIVRSLQNVTGQSSAEDNAAAEKGDQARPRSCVDSSSGFAFNDIASTVKKRWSGIQFGSKLVSAFERLGIDDEEEYTDSLENTVREVSVNPEPSSPINTDDPNELVSTATYTDSEDAVTEVDFPLHGLKFKELQRRWEMIADISLNNSNDTHINDDSESSNIFPSKISETSFTINKSRIPRPVTSPVRPPSLQFSVAPQSATVASTTAKKHSPLSPNSNIPMPINRKTNTHNTSNLPKINISKSKSTSGATTRTSRIDQSSSNSSSHIARPTSLSHRSPQKSASESKINALKKRPTSTSSRRSNSSQRFVRTLSHRLPSDNGHLSFNEGETLRVILDVDDKWILCCRGDQKGLVPRSAVLPISGHI